jgi:hypothetical protein
MLFKTRIGSACGIERAVVPSSTFSPGRSTENKDGTTFGTPLIMGIASVLLQSYRDQPTSNLIVSYIAPPPKLTFVAWKVTVLTPACNSEAGKVSGSKW